VLRTLLRWYRESADVESLLPLLSTVLGHVHPEDTYWYFEGAPERLALAADRLERTGAAGHTQARERASAPGPAPAAVAAAATRAASREG
jgi:hypothetical protein